MRRLLLDRGIARDHLVRRMACLVLGQLVLLAIGIAMTSWDQASRFAIISAGVTLGSLTGMYLRDRRRQRRAAREIGYPEQADALR